MTLSGLGSPSNTVLSFFNAQATITDPGLDNPNPSFTLAASTLTVSNILTLGSSSTLNFGVGTNATKIAVTGNLTLGGTVNIADTGSFTATSYTLLTYAGTLTGGTLTIGTTPNGSLSYAVNTNTIGSVILQVTGGSDPFTTWQTHYFTGSPLNSAPGAEPLGKGMSNTNQFLAGFNPTNAAAYLHVISIVESVAGNTNVVVTILGANGDNTYAPGIASRTNVLDYLTGNANGDYTNGGWQDTGQTNILSGGNGPARHQHDEYGNPGYLD